MDALNARRIRNTIVGSSACAALAAASLVAVTPASAATVDVALSPLGNASATLNVGDTITFQNTDAVTRSPLFTSSTGLVCSTGLVVQPGSTQSCVATLPGVFTYTDPARLGLAAGTITVNAAPPASGTPSVAPSISLAPPLGPIDFGSPTTLTGSVVPAVAGTAVDLLGRAAGESTFSTLATTLTTAGGGYVFTVEPRSTTEYRVVTQGGSSASSSPVATVQVRPSVSLKKRFVKHGRAYLTARALSSTSYKGKRLVVQRHNRHGGWTTVKTVRLNAKSTVKFSVRLPKGVSKVRVFMPASEVGPGYTRAASNAVKVKRR